MNRTTRFIAPLALAALVLTGCGGAQDSSPAGGTSSATSASASPSSAAPSSASATPTPQESSPASSAAPRPSTPAANPAQPPADDGRTTSLDEFLVSGGRCGSDVFPAGPPTEEALTDIQNHCGVMTVPGNPDQRQDGSGQADPSQEYRGYVATGFEYQVGSPCFDPALGRCKTSGEIQSEYNGG